MNENNKRKKAMNYQEVKSLIIIRNEPEMLEAFDNCTFGHDISDMWDRLALKHGHGYTGDDCRVKYNNLRKKFWDEKDKTRKSGSEASNWKYWDIMSEHCVKGKNNEPPFVFDSANVTPKSGLSSDFLHTSEDSICSSDAELNVSKKKIRSKKKNFEDLCLEFNSNSNKRFNLLERLVDNEEKRNCVEPRVKQIEDKVEKIIEDNKELKNMLQKVLNYISKENSNK